MIAQRITWHVKIGQVDEMVALLRPYLQDADGSLKRVYTPNLSPYDVVVGEFEYESLAALESDWNEWNASDEAADFMPKFLALREGSSNSEVWTLAE